MPALCLCSRYSIIAQNYAGIIRQTLLLIILFSNSDLTTAKIRTSLESNGNEQVEFDHEQRHIQFGKLLGWFAHSRGLSN